MSFSLCGISLMYCENGSRQGKYGGGWVVLAKPAESYAMGVSANSVASVKSQTSVVSRRLSRVRAISDGVLSVAHLVAIIITSATSHLCRWVVWRIAHSLRPAVCSQITFSAPFEKDGSMPFSVMLVRLDFSVA